MGYQALLFCPDEKTARTVTQVLSELEFTVEPCAEPFAAVKKLMAEHFDAVVVDCDNEQNATLLFKSARNSATNHASLAVAVVEGQAGVAKAFRIGANLVLTKPINVEQAKGTLRVARGLLRKADPNKAPASTAAASAPAPAKSVASGLAIPAAPVKPISQAPAPAPSRPVASAPVAKPVASPTPVAAPAARAAIASSTPAAHDAAPIKIDAEVSAPAPIGNSASASPMAPAFKSIAAQPAKPSPIGATSSVFGSGAASAPAPARIPAETKVEEAITTPAVENVDPVAAAADATRNEADISAVAALTFGGANVPVEASGGSKKVLIGIAATVIVVAALYFGWTQVHGPSNTPDLGLKPTASPASSNNVPATNAPTTNPQSAPMAAKPTVANTSASPTEPAQTAFTANTVNPSLPAKHAAAITASNSPKFSTDPDAPSASSPVKNSTVAKPAPEPIVVKNDSSFSLPKNSAAAADTPAPSLVGIATTGSGGALTNLIAPQTNGPKPLLQTVSISQGVSQGLIVKKVQPNYPASALHMRVEGPVQVLATISKSGNITAVKIVNGEPLLARAAADAVKQWKYKPYLLNGEPVEVQTQITINFKLPN